MGFEEKLSAEVGNTRFLNKILDNLPVAILILDTGLEVCAANGAIADLTGRTREDLLHKRPGEAMGCLQAKDSANGCGHGVSCAGCLIRNSAEAALTKNTSANREGTSITITVNGIPTWKDVLLDALPIRLDGAPFALLCISDVSEFRNLERSLLLHLERFAMIGAQASQITHDLKNPLTVIDGFAQLLAMGELSEDQKEQVSLLREGVARIGAMVEEITEIASGRASPSLDTTRTSLKDLLDRITANNTFHHKIVVDCRFRGSVEVDPVKIEMVLLNLIRNADQALDQVENGLIEIACTESSGSVVIKVRDNGPGVGESVRNHLFEPADAILKKGKGFGLFGAKRIVEAHGGTLWFTTEPGHGSSFFVQLSVGPNNYETQNPVTRSTDKSTRSKGAQ